jgi:cleavage and polyadenylation specificity factor subunit 3
VECRETRKERHTPKETKTKTKTKTKTTTIMAAAATTTTAVSGARPSLPIHSTINTESYDPTAPGYPSTSGGGIPGSSSTHAVQITPLGAGQEVGRSCIIVKYLDKTIMMDCGIHPGYHGHASLPFLDHVDLSSVDVMLVTHFHLDHVAAVPFVVGHTNFKGRIFMTHPTKAIAHTLLKDLVKLNKGGQGALYSDADVERMVERTEVIDFQQTIDVDGIRITAYRAGHVLGAAMFMVEVAGMRCLYTGDYSRIADRHMPAADLPADQRPNIVIVESTYGVSRHLPRKEREEKFASMVHASVAKGGRVLLPVVALGRAQELLLILEEYWSTHPELHGVPIYQASGLARRAMTVYRSYIEMMNDDIRDALKKASKNPFEFRHVTHLRSTSQFDDVGPCVVMATPSMLQSGMSRELFEAWCGDPKNCTIIADFAVQGTLARDILSSPKDVLARSGARLPLRCQVDAISFSAHADFPQTSEFLDRLDPPHVVLVHGEAGEMMRLKKALEQRGKVLGVERTVHAPKVTHEVSIAHAPKRRAALFFDDVGDNNERTNNNNRTNKNRIHGVVVKKNSQLAIVGKDDLRDYTKLQTGSVTQRQCIMYRGTFDRLRLHLEMTFDDVFFVHGCPESSRDEHSPEMVRIGDSVTVLRCDPCDPCEEEENTQRLSNRIVLEWVGGGSNDAIADAVIALVLLLDDDDVFEEENDECCSSSQEEGEKEGEKKEKKEKNHRHHDVLRRVLNAQFGDTRVDEKTGTMFVDVDGKHVIVEQLEQLEQLDREDRGIDADRGPIRVTCADGALKARVEVAVARLLRCISLSSSRR